jgi:phage terminase large subunit GpA-like protein
MPDQGISAICDKIEAAFGGFRPPPNMTVSQWADAYRVLSSESSAEPGRFRTSRAEYQRGMMDSMNDPNIENIVFKTSSQVGKTTLIENLIGYCIDYDPSPMLFVLPTLEMASTISKNRLSAMIRDTPCLTGKVGDPKSRNANNTVMSKDFAGGSIAMCGANSPASLASRPIRVLLMDEIDRFPFDAGTEGSPIELAVKRTTNFWNRKIVKVSTPTVKDMSAIESAYLASDQRVYFVPCKSCGLKQKLLWENVKWEKNHHLLAHYECSGCKAHWSDVDLNRAVSAGGWVATAVSVDGKTAGFHIWELYSPWVTMGKMVTGFLEAKKSPQTLKVFINTSFGECWEADKEKIEADALQDRVEPYLPDPLPYRSCLITIGVDTQDDRLVAVVVAWGPAQCWVLDYITVYGSPAKRSTWNELDAYRKKEYAHPATGVLVKAAITMIDSGGHYTQQVYRYCKEKQSERVYASKGSSVAGYPLVGKAKRPMPGGARLIFVGTSTAKDDLFSRLKILDMNQDGYIHFGSNLPSEFFLELTAEAITTRFVNGFPTRVYNKIRERNEALDCVVLCMAGEAFLRPDYAAIAKGLGVSDDILDDIDGVDMGLDGDSGWEDGGSLGVPEVHDTNNAVNPVESKPTPVLPKPAPPLTKPRHVLKQWGLLS